ncbi:MAG: porin family protein [Desulfobacteraceae bacterium]|nr:porin family protein [Desulfobacteraceae bacterium]
MKKILLLSILLYLFPQNVFCASQGNFLDLIPVTPGETCYAVVLQADYQKNEFPQQRDRKTEIDSIGQERHFSEKRSSDNTFSYSGIKAGVNLKNLPFFYLTAGYAKAEIDFSFSDELTRNKKKYSKSVSMESDAFPVFGAGICGRIYRTEMLKDYHFNLGLDLNYRFLDFDMNENDIDYASELHEIQLSLAGSVDSFTWKPFSRLELNFSPYAGCKISHFIGDEVYKDLSNRDYTGTPDPISYKGDIETSNHVSFFLGTGIQLTRSMLMTIETRSGDENGYALNLIYKF